MLTRYIDSEFIFNNPFFISRLEISDDSFSFLPTFEEKHTEKSERKTQKKNFSLFHIAGAIVAGRFRPAPSTKAPRPLTLLRHAGSVEKVSTRIFLIKYDKIKRFYYFPFLKVEKVLGRGKNNFS